MHTNAKFANFQMSFCYQGKNYDIEELKNESTILKWHAQRALAAYQKSIKSKICPGFLVWCGEEVKRGRYCNTCSTKKLQNQGMVI
jgi:hypothetical protein